MIERILTFLVIGFFVFSPQIQSFWSSDPVRWYGNYGVWFALILICYFAVRRRWQGPADPPGE